MRACWGNDRENKKEKPMTGPVMGLRLHACSGSIEIDQKLGQILTDPFCLMREQILISF